MTNIKYFIVLSLILLSSCSSSLNENAVYKVVKSNYEELLERVDEHLKENESTVLSNLDEDTYKVILYEKLDNYGLAKFNLSGLNKLIINKEEVKKKNERVNVLYLNDDYYSYIGLVIEDNEIVNKLHEINVIFKDTNSNVSINTNSKATIIDFTSDTSVTKVLFKDSSGEIIHTYIPNN